LGGVGAILMVLTVVPYVSMYGIIPLVGAILVLIAMKGFADYYREAGIFNNALYGILSLIVGAVATFAVAFFAVADFFRTLGYQLNLTSTADLQNFITSINWQSIEMNTLFRMLGYIFLAIVVLFIFAIVAAVFMRKSLGLLRNKSNVGLFGTTGTVLLVGAVLTIIGFGVILIWISGILLTIAFFSMREQPQQPAPPPMPQQVQM
jgi:uncharacterized membrane protein